jgi:predicted dienelactone hydrolase
VAEPEIRELTDPKRSRWDTGGHRPVRVYLWEPDGTPSSSAAPPLLLLSHGTGGSALEMFWLAEALVSAGNRVAATDHHGNNYVDGFLPEGFTCGWERARDFTFLLDVLAEQGELGPVGVAGFSLGGYTAAALLGARIAVERMMAVFDGTTPMPPLPEFPDLRRALAERWGDDGIQSLVQPGGRDFSDDRVEAAFLICPAIGMLLDERSLAEITRPVAIRWGGADDITPGSENALRYAEFIPGAECACVGPDVAHLDFTDQPAGSAARKAVSADAVAFFRQQLGRAGT